MIYTYLVSIFYNFLKLIWFYRFEYITQVISGNLDTLENALLKLNYVLCLGFNFDTFCKKLVPGSLASFSGLF